MKQSLGIGLVAAFWCLAGLPVEAAVELQSPDGLVAVTFDLKPVNGGAATPVYHVSHRNRPILGESRLGLELDSGPLTNGFRLVRETRTRHDTTWKPVCGERESIRDHYQQVVLELAEQRPPQRVLQLTFRAYNEGVAFCYTLPEQPALKAFTLTAEHTRFTVTNDPVVWAVYSAQGLYDRETARLKNTNAEVGEVRFSKLAPGVERPLTMRLAADSYAAITEAKLVDYARMKLRPAKDQPGTLEAFLDAERGRYGQVKGTTPFSTPWRVILVADSPGQLLERNDLILNLNDPCALTDTAWIKPGKVLRESTLTTAGGRACVDFCVRRGLQYIEYDAGWYGFEYDPKSDARDVHLDPKRNPDPTSLNLREVIDYANSRGIGVILYVNHLAAERQLDEILPLYRQWGVKGVKYGFVNVGSQEWTRWLHHAIRKAAENQLMVDIHDEFRSTGYQRTYPNLMTVEGILGNEGFPTPVHNATLPFTRYLTGPGDYTFCWTSGRLKPTHAHQLAISTIYYSPWQFLFWYDRPSQIREEPALDYWQHLPTSWDETRVLQGDIGKLVTLARRKGREWYLGSIQTTGRRQYEIPLGFLTPGQKYTATVYADESPDQPDAKGVRITTLTVTSATVLPADLPANGGLAVRIVPLP